MSCRWPTSFLSKVERQRVQNGFYRAAYEQGSIAVVSGRQPLPPVCTLHRYAAGTHVPSLMMKRRFSTYGDQSKQPNDTHSTEVPPESLHWNNNIFPSSGISDTISTVHAPIDEDLDEDDDASLWFEDEEELLCRYHRRTVISPDSGEWLESSILGHVPSIHTSPIKRLDHAAHGKRDTAQNSSFEGEQRRALSRKNSKPHPSTANEQKTNLKTGAIVQTGSSGLGSRTTLDAHKTEVRGRQSSGETKSTAAQPHHDNPMKPAPSQASSIGGNKVIGISPIGVYLSGMGAGRGRRI